MMTTHMQATLDMTQSVYETNLPLSGRRQGKVRDIYQLPANGVNPPRILIIATDRVSAFDVVLPTPIPGKGRLLTTISTHWFDFIRSLNIVSDHLLSTSPDDLSDLSDEQRASIEGRMTLGRAAEVIPVEFVVRGYITGSGWVEYGQSQSVCGIPLAAGLQQCEKLPEPIFTPATKADVGHDENIDFKRACSIAGREVMEQLRDIWYRRG